MPPANFIPISRSGDFKMSASWGPVPDGFVHGILLGYHVYYTKIQQTGRPVTTQIDKKIFGPYEHNTTILLLDNFAIYNLEIAAFTIKGDGARSQIKDGCKWSVYEITEFLDLTVFFWHISVASIWMVIRLGYIHRLETLGTPSTSQYLLC